MDRYRFNDTGCGQKCKTRHQNPTGGMKILPSVDCIIPDPQNGALQNRRVQNDRLSFVHCVN